MIKNLTFTAWRFLDWFTVREQFANVFPRAEFDSYGSFVGDRGACLKSEPRTLVVLLKRRCAGGGRRKFRRKYGSVRRQGILLSFNCRECGPG